MALLLTDDERRAAPQDGFYWALLGRAARQAESPGLSVRGTTAQWWHVTSEYVTDAAMAHALKPSEPIAAWLRAAVLDIVRRPVADWVGPAFRDHSSATPAGNLETAHLCWSCAVALDLAPDVFTEPERDEIASVLRERGVPMCLRFLDGSRNLANWRCVLTAGLTVPAVVLGEREWIGRAAEEFRICCETFQPDGTYGEGVQYSNYAASTLMLSSEALRRHDPSQADRFLPRAYAGAVRWWAASHLYRKPLSGWGAYPRPRSVNFCDAAALFAPSADTLLHISARMQDEAPVDAGLARWLFEEVYRENPAEGPHDRSSFGFLNRFGFLTLPLQAQAAEPVTPEQAGLPTLAAFSCGDAIARDRWNGRTVLAVHGGGDPLNGPGHLHGDLNHFLLAHNRERLLVDPGHSCYRSLIHDVETASSHHNTCTFALDPAAGPALQENLLRGAVLQQARDGHRRIENGRPGAPLDRGACRLIAAQSGPVSAIGSEAAALYGAPIESFSRFWLLCGAHTLFVVDQIVSAQPVRTIWNWVLNNRDDALELKLFRPDRLVARRGNAGMKLFHTGGGTLSGPAYGFVHDAYHPLPAQAGEGRPGSGTIVRWQENRSRTERVVVHAIAVDDYGAIAGWHFHAGENGYTLEGPGAREVWRLSLTEDPLRLQVADVDGRRWEVAADGGRWELREANQ